MDPASVRINLAWDSRNKNWRIWATSVKPKGTPVVLTLHKVATGHGEIDRIAAGRLIAVLIAEIDSWLF